MNDSTKNAQIGKIGKKDLKEILQTSRILIGDIEEYLDSKKNQKANSQETDSQ